MEIGINPNKNEYAEKKWINNYPDKLLPVRLYHCVNAFTQVNLQHNWTNLNRLRICTCVNRGVWMNSQ